MVQKIRVIPVINNSNEENTDKVEDVMKVEEDDIHVEEDIIKLEDDEIREDDEIHTHDKLPDKPNKGKKDMLNNMPTTEKVITQVQCQACGKIYEC
jgi:hypothetical protein